MADEPERFDMAKCRALLLYTRRQKFGRGNGGRAAMAKRSGLKASFIATAEKGPDATGLETAAKFIEGCGMELDQFFALLKTVEKVDEKGLPVFKTAHNEPTLTEYKGQPEQPGGAGVMSSDVDSAVSAAVAAEIRGLIRELETVGSAVSNSISSAANALTAAASALSRAALHAANTRHR